PLLITWHGVFAVLGIIAAARLGFWLLQKDVPNLTGTGDGLAWMVALGLVGARLLYVWENFRLFANGQLLRVFALTEGGISQWGGLFGAIAGVFIWSRRAKYSFWKILDASGPAAMLGLAIGRMGSLAWCTSGSTPRAASRSATCARTPPSLPVFARRSSRRRRWSWPPSYLYRFSSGEAHKPPSQRRGPRVMFEIDVDLLMGGH